MIGIDVTFEAFLFFVVISAAIIALIAVVVGVRNSKYTNFVKQHSQSLKALDGLNHIYKFKNIKSFDMIHSYDNENFYDNISPEDYLIYQLVYIQKDVLKAIKETSINAELFQRYIEEIKERCRFGQFDVDDLPHSKRKLLRTEKRLLIKNTQDPTIEFAINVTLNLTNINGVHRHSKYTDFDADDVKHYIHLINQRNGNYFNNREIWDSICRVERGKVTNKMRFAIMARDGYRCVKCGRPDSRAYLEIDHIIPIAKGGKSTYDNLQTLCHRCNVKKGANIEY